LTLNDKSTLPIPEPIVQLQRQLDQFRSAQPHRTKLPEALWQAAVELARQHGLHAVAHLLRLDYMGLKRRLAGGAEVREKKKSASPGFVELIAAPPAAVAQCVIEFESRGGGKMRQWKASTPPAVNWNSRPNAVRAASADWQPNCCSGFRLAISNPSLHPLRAIGRRLFSESG
jgi:hypothetical protein